MNYTKVTAEKSGEFTLLRAWETEDDGNVVACIHMQTGDYTMIDHDAILSPKVKAAIQDVIGECRSNQEIPEGYCCVHFAIEGRYDAWVPQGTVEEMKQAGTLAYYDADFGDLHDVVGTQIVYIQDHDGNYLYEC